MATFLDVTGLQHFSSIFVFLFVWIVVYAILAWTKVLGQNNLVTVLVGLLMGIFVLISPLATTVVANTAPFLAVIFVLIMLMSIASKMLGGHGDAVPGLKGVMMVFIVFVIIIGVGVQIRSQIDSSTADTKDLSKTVNILFNPTFMGVVLIFAIAIFTIALLAQGGVH